MSSTADFNDINALLLEMVNRVVAAESEALLPTSGEPLNINDGIASTPAEDWPIVGLDCNTNGPIGPVLPPPGLPVPTFHDDGIVNVQNVSPRVGETSSISSTESGNIDKTSLIWAAMYSKYKADIYFYNAKWKGIDKSFIDSTDVQIVKEKKDFINYLQRMDLKRQFKFLGRMALELRIDLKEHYEFSDIKMMQENLNDIHGVGVYRIHLFELKNGECKQVWSGATPSERNMLILHKDGQFSYPLNLGKLLGRRYYCFDCLETCKFKVSHRCENRCRSCSTSLTICNDRSDFSQRCTECNMFFLSKGCYERHKKPNNNGSKRCQVVQFCMSCSRVFNVSKFLPGEAHSCEKNSFCLRCLRYTEPSKMHACYNRSITDATKKRRKEQEKKLRILAFDFETTQCVDKEDGSLGFDYLEAHEVVMVVARKSCFLCFDRTRKDVNASCSACGDKQIIIDYNTSDNVLDAFIDWLFQPIHDGMHIYAHYGGRFDLLLLLHGIVKRKIAPNVIMRGRRLIGGSITYNECTIQLRDSFNLIPLALDSFKKAFALNVSQKGEFGFKLIQKKYFGETFVGLPPKRFYAYEGKSPEKEAAFHKWYDSHDPNYVYCVDTELRNYCSIDVDILLLSLLEYREAMLRMTNWCVLSNSMTLASFALFILRVDHIPPRTIAAVPDHGYNNNRQQSDLVIKWIRYMAVKMGCNIQHVGNGGEKRVDLPLMSTFVDGFTTLETGEEIVFEGNGCWYHGHNKCFDPNGFNVRSQQTYGALYASTMARLEMLKRKYSVISIWECEIRALLKRDKEAKLFFDTCEISRLEPRLAMQDKYPSIMMNCDVPTGPPTIWTNGFPPTPSTIFPWNGLGHITILPPQNLRYPVLGVKMNNTLLFALCKFCSAKKSTTRCTHNERQRSFTATWTHFEIRKALSKGYVILSYHEVWEYKTFSNTLFKRYIQTFYREKIRASGWPAWVKNDEDKLKCLDNYKNTMGITLAIEEVEDNPSRKLVGKLLLNTSWGKLAQRSELHKTRFCTQEELGELIRTKANIRGYHEVSDDFFLVSLAKNPEEIHSDLHGSVPIACYITSQARLKLYEMLEASEGRDSIIAVIPKDRDPFKHLTSDGLGFLGNECVGKRIDDVVLGGPKQYAIRMTDEKTGEVSTIIKIRGFTLDSAASKIIDYEVFERLVRGGGQAVVERMNLKRKHTSIKTVKETKAYSAVNTKGMNIKGEILPYGYISDE